MGDQPGVIRILIADDHRMFRDAIRHILNSDMILVGEASDGEEVLQLLPRLKPDVLLLDITMPRMGGMEVLRALPSMKLEVRTILLTAAISHEDMMEAVRLGVHGIVIKRASTLELLKAIRKVSAGEYWLSRETMMECILGENLAESASDYRLTSREWQIIQEVLSSASNCEIAAKLYISEDTVKRHLTNIFDKLGVSSRLELAMFASNHKLRADK